MEFKSLAIIAARVLLALVVGILLLRLLENRFVFFPEKIPLGRPLPQTPGFALKSFWLHTSDDVRLNGWLITSQGRTDPTVATVLYLHGNAGSMFDRIERLQSLAAQGWQVFAVDYRGYGWSSGRPTEAGLYCDAATAYEFLVYQMHTDPHTLFFYGESLGTAVAIELALEHPSRGLILEAPFTSFKDMGKAHYSVIPGFVYRFLNNDWDSFDRIKQLRVPKLIIHGERDRVVPFDLGRRLFEGAPPPKAFYPVPGADHMECLELGGYKLMNQLKAFVDEAKIPAVHPTLVNGP
jgi:uncharacterized protein